MLALAVAAVVMASGRPVRAQSIWNTQGNGVWSRPANWVGGVPNGNNATASFPSYNTNITVTVDQNFQVQDLEITNNFGASYRLSQGGASVLSFTGKGNVINVLDSNTGDHVIRVPLTLSNSDLTITNASTTGSLSVFGSIGETEARMVTIKGPGQLLLTGKDSSYSGGTVVDGGNVQIIGDDNLGKANTPVTVKNGGILIGGGGQNPLETNRNISLSNGATLGSGGFLAPFVVSGVVSGDGGLTVNGLLNLTGINTFKGGVTVSNNSSLGVTNDKGLGDASNDVTLSVGTLTALQNFSSARTLHLNTLGSIDTNSNQVALTGTIDGNGGLNVRGGGTLTIDKLANTQYQGSTTINSTVLSVINDNYLGVRGNIQLSSGGALRITGPTPQTANGGGISVRDVTVDAGGRIDVTGTNVFTLAGDLKGNGNLTKGDTGTLQFQHLGKNTGLTGQIIVDNGAVGVLKGVTLKVTDGLLAAGKVYGKGTLQGGTKGVVIQSKGTISPGESVGTFTTIGDSEMQSGSTFEFKINSANGITGGPIGWNHWDITGSLNLNISGSPIDFSLLSYSPWDTPGPLSDFDPTQSYDWTVITTTGGITGFGSPGEFVFDTSGFLNDLMGGQLSVAQEGNNLDLVFTPAAAVPEPGTLVLSLVLAATFAGRTIISAHLRRVPHVG
jgi:autotransporter-associated beta strand protein